MNALDNTAKSLKRNSLYLNNLKFEKIKKFKLESTARFKVWRSSDTIKKVSVKRRGSRPEGRQLLFFVCWLLVIKCYSVGHHSSLVANWLLVPEVHGSNPGEGENLYSFIFESQSHDCS